MLIHAKTAAMTSDSSISYVTMKEEKDLDTEAEKPMEFGFGTSSKLRETGVILLILCIQFLGLAMDTMPKNFFAYEATREKHMRELQAGIVFGCYDFARLLTAPFCSLVVSYTICAVLADNKVLDRDLIS